MKRTLTFLLAAALACPALAQPPANQPDAQAPKPDAPKKELTRKELAKLGGFEPAPADAADEGPINLNFDVLMVSVPNELAVPLAESFRDPAKVDAACEKLMGLIAAKKARVTAWPRLQVRSGTRAVAENIQEVRYATEFEPLKPAAPDQAAPEPPAPPKPAPPAGNGPPGPLIQPTPAAQGMIPTAFETRNAGATLEVEPIVGPDGVTMDISISVQNVRLIGWDNITERENGALKISLPQPRFETNKVTQSLTIRSGQRMLLGTSQLSDPKDQMEFFILGASVSHAAAKKKEKAH